jgi:hypothetical protein
MATLDQIRAVAVRRTREDGVIVDSDLPHRFGLSGTIGEVKSLSPARVEILSGPTIDVDAYIGPIPAVNDIVLVIEVAQFRAVVTGVEII